MIILSEVSVGFEYLQSEKIVHCDLCASNILLDSRNMVKISDFGLAISLKTDEQMLKCSYLRNLSASSTTPSTIKVRIKWTAPESLNGSNFSLKSDVWSYSVLLWEIFTYGRVPYSRVSAHSMHEFLTSGHRLKAPDHCPAQIYELMKLCWNLKPIDRPSFTFIKYFLLNLKNKKLIQ